MTPTPGDLIRRLGPIIGAAFALGFGITVSAIRAWENYWRD